MLPNKKYTVADFVAIAKRRLWLVALPAAVGLFLALVVSSRLTNVYQAETLMQIVSQRVPDRYVPSPVTIKLEERLEALKEQVQSRTQLEKIIVDFNLYPSARATRPMQDVVEGMRPNLDLKTVRSSRAGPVDAFYLTFIYSDPVVATRVVERLSVLYTDANQRERTNVAEGTSAFLQAQLADAKARLDGQDEKLKAFQEAHSGRLPSQVTYNMQVIQNTQLQRQSVVEALARARDRKLVVDSLYNDAVSAPLPVSPMTATAAASPTTLATLPPRQQLDLAKATLAQLEQKLTEGHPDLRRARRQVADLEKQVAALPTETTPTTAPVATGESLQRRERISALRAELDSLPRQIERLEADEKRLTKAIADYQSRIEAVPGAESEFNQLTRDYDTLQAAFKDLLTKSEAARVAAELEIRQIGETFRVLDPPRVPLRPISPQRPLITAAGLGAGLLFGLVLVVLLELRDGSLKTDADVEQVLRLPVVAIVPTMLTDADHARERRWRLMVSAAAAVVVVAAGVAFWSMKLWTFIA